MSAPPEIEATLRAAGALDDDATLDIAEAALALAALDRPRVSLDRYRRHLDRLAGDVRSSAAPESSAGEAAQALSAVLAGDHGYEGDELTYDDPQNANLMRVIDRRKGLPVALGILYIHAARACGWAMHGVNFPAHFLVRLEAGGERLLLDPFGGGRTLEAADLRALLHRLGGEGVELTREHHRAIPDRDVLLRLQNNIKLRARRAGDIGRAAAVQRRMVLLAPARAPLHRELCLLEVQAGNLGSAIEAGEAYLARAPDERQRHDAALLLQRLKAALN